jgi:Tetratricopeptide repeat
MILLSILLSTTSAAAAPAAATAAAAATATATPAQVDSRSIYLEARGELLEERFDKALVLFEQVVDRFPASEEADDAEYYLGYSYQQLGRDDEAIDAFTRVIEHWPDSVRVESARSHRAEIAARKSGSGADRDRDRDRDILDDVFAGSGSWELKRDTAYALARRGNFAAADVLEEALERESSSRQAELIRILADHTSDPEARRLLVTALEHGRSTGVQLRTLEALDPVAGREEVAAAVESLLSGSGSGSTSTAVSLAALRLLSTHLDEPRARQAASHALESGNSSSVQMLACSSLGGGLLSPEVLPSTLQLFRESNSTSVQLQCVKGIENRSGDLAAAEVLEEAISSPSTSTSVKLEAIRIAMASETPAVRAAARAGIRAGNSTSVQLRAVAALASGQNDESTAEALEALFSQDGCSTSVLLGGLDALASHLETRSGPRVLRTALAPNVSTSVQLKALEVALPFLQNTEVRAAVGSAIRADNSTSVLLKAVEALDKASGDVETRRLLEPALDEDFSTSVVLATMNVLDRYVASDPAVKDAYSRVVDNDELSATARVRAAEQLLPVSDSALKERIADAMEEIATRARRRGFSLGGDAFDRALEVLGSIDKNRAEKLRARE